MNLNYKEVEFYNKTQTEIMAVHEHGAVMRFILSDEACNEVGKTYAGIDGVVGLTLGVYADGYMNVTAVVSDGKEEDMELEMIMFVGQKSREIISVDIESMLQNAPLNCGGNTVDTLAKLIEYLKEN